MLGKISVDKKDIADVYMHLCKLKRMLKEARERGQSEYSIRQSAIYAEYKEFKKLYNENGN